MAVSSVRDLKAFLDEKVYDSLPDRLHPGAQRLCSQRLPLPERVSQGEFRVQMSISALLAVNRFCGFHVFFRPTI